MTMSKYNKLSIDYLCGLKHCSRSMQCYVVKHQPYRDYSKFLTPQVPSHLEETEGVLQEDKEEFYFPTPNTAPEMHSMMSSLSSSNIPKMSPSKDRFTIEDLPKSPPLPVGHVDKAYLVRYQDPSNFSVILALANYPISEQDWTPYFPPAKNSPQKFTFQTGLALFRGFTFLLSRYMERPLPFDELTLKTGDLVICAVRRDRTLTLEPAAPHFGYRGVILDTNLKILNPGPTIKPDHGPIFSVYLLDTGETRVVEAGEGFLAPLPKPFTQFPPLAVNCALHGVSPVGLEWTKDASVKIKTLMTPNLQRPAVIKNLVLEFFSKKAEGFKEPYFVEVTVVEENGTVENKQDSPETCWNLTTELLRNKLGLEWNLFPRQPAIHRQFFTGREILKEKEEPEEEEDWGGREGNSRRKKKEEEKRKEEEIRRERGTILGAAQGNPGRVLEVTEERLKREFRRTVLADFKRLSVEMWDLRGLRGAGEEKFGGNVLAMAFRKEDYSKK